MTLRERLGVLDAVVTGLGAMLGAGLFLGLAPVSSFAGRWTPVAITIAAVTAGCCCCSVSDQACADPGSGGGYRFARERLGRWSGRVTGGLFLVSRAAAATALAGTFGAYVAPARPLLPALVLLALAVGADAAGVRLPRPVVRALVAFVLLVLLFVVAAAFAIRPAPPAVAPAPDGGTSATGFGGVLPGAGVAFFGFLGFERIAAPGSDQAMVPRRRLRLVLPLLMAVALAIYLAVGAAALRQLGPVRLALSGVPIRDTLAASSASALDPLVTAAVAVGTGLALLLVASGGRRTADVMARGGDLPTAASRPVRDPVANLLVGVTAAAGLLVASPVQAIELAATCGLFYSAFTAASGRLLDGGERLWPARISCLGLGLVVVIGLTMPPVYLAVTLGVILVAGVAGPVLARVRTGSIG